MTPQPPELLPSHGYETVEAADGGAQSEQPSRGQCRNWHVRLGRAGAACALLAAAAAVAVHVGRIPAGLAPLIADDGADSETGRRDLIKARQGTGHIRKGEPQIVELSGIFDKHSSHPINVFDKHLDGVKFEGAGLYYQFTTASGQLIFSGQVEGKPGDWSDSKTPLPMASASKLFTGFATMVTMQLVPSQWYPEKYVNEFDGWKDFANFPVADTNKKANLTIHQLLTHTSGLPFAMRSSKEDIQKMSLFYMPGTGFGYTLGHRVLGWLMRDFWMKQPASARTLNGKVYNIKNADDAFRFLVFDRLGMSANTKFDDTMKTMFGMSGHAGDAAIQSTGEDLTKLAVVALRKGKLLDGHVLINETNWNAWAMKNLLPGGKQSKDLVGWEKHSASWADWNVGGMKEQIMRQSGDYGWNYFGATYFMDTRKEIGWCGFFSSCLRVSYTQNAAFVMMQRDVSDLKKSKPYVVQHFDELAKSLQCSKNQQKSCPAAPKLSVGSCCALPCANCPFGHVADSAGCGAHGGFKCSDVFCQTCSTSGFFSKTTTCTDDAWSHSCPSNATRAKMLTYDENMDELHHSCYVPFPNSCSGGAPGR